MCHWRYDIYKDADWDSRVCSFPFAGGVFADVQDRSRALRRARRAVAGYVGAHPGCREGICIVETSCNGPQREIRPYAPGGEQQREFVWDFDDDDDDEALFLLPPSDEPVPVITDEPTLTLTDEEDDDALRDWFADNLASATPPSRQSVALGGDVERSKQALCSPRVVGEGAERVAGATEAPIPGLSDEWDAVRQYFARPVDPTEKEQAWERLMSCVDSVGGHAEGRSNDEDVKIGVPSLYGLLRARRDFELACGKLFVARVGDWDEPDYAIAKTVSSLEEAQAAVSGGGKLIVYAQEDDEPLWSYDHDWLYDPAYIAGLEELLGAVSAYFADVAEVPDLERWRAQIERLIDDLLPEMVRREAERDENHG